MIESVYHALRSRTYPQTVLAGGTVSAVASRRVAIKITPVERPVMILATLASRVSAPLTVVTNDADELAFTTAGRIYGPATPALTAIAIKVSAQVSPPSLLPADIWWVPPLPLWVPVGTDFYLAAVTHSADCTFSVMFTDDSGDIGRVGR